MNNHTRELVIMVGESGSGKSTIAKKMATERVNYIRLNRDDLRIELATDPKAPKGRNFESFVSKIQMSRAGIALKEDKSVIIDDTNLNPNTRAKWEKFAQHKASFRQYRLMTSLEDCILNDNKRSGKAHVGRAVIERQFLMSGRLPIDLTKKIILCDIDGTVSNSEGLRSPFDESKVINDRVYPVIANWLRNLYNSHNIFLVSGRHSTCGEDTISWFNNNNIPFHYIFMRHGWDNRKDFIVKEEILNELLKIVDKNQIEFCIDDRNQVIQNCWRKNGIKCIPVRGTPDHSLKCPNFGIDQKETCSFCGAIGNF